MLLTIAIFVYISITVQRQNALNQFKNGMPEETKEKCRLRSLGRKHTEESKEKMKGKNNYGWKGDDVGYSALHSWVKRNLGKPTKCEHCRKDGLTGKKIHWANIDHQYKRNLDDWIRLCCKCHIKYDKSISKRVLTHQDSV